MLHSIPLESTNGAPHDNDGINLQAAYIVLIRSFLRQSKKNYSQNPTYVLLPTADTGQVSLQSVEVQDAH